jgi:chromosome segregation ATPase
MISWNAKMTSSLKKTKKFVKLKNAYALEVEKNENLFKELSMCNDSISSLRIENDKLVSKIEKLNHCNDSIICLRDENARLNSKIEELNICKPSTSTVEHVSICTRCRDINVEAIDDHLAMIKNQNDHIATLNTKIVEHELENEKFKFAHSMLYNGRRPGIKDGIG